MKPLTILQAQLLEEISTEWQDVPFWVRQPTIRGLLKRGLIEHRRKRNWIGEWLTMGQIRKADNG